MLSNTFPSSLIVPWISTFQPCILGSNSLTKSCNQSPYVMQEKASHLTSVFWWKWDKIYTLTTSKHTFEFSYNLNFLNILCKLIIVGREKYEIRRSSQLRTLLKLVVVSRTWKKFSGPYGIWTHDLCDTGAALHQLS